LSDYPLEYNLLIILNKLLNSPNNIIDKENFKIINTPYLIYDNDNNKILLNKTFLNERLLYDNLEKILEIKYPSQYLRLFRYMTKVIESNIKDMKNYCILKPNIINEILIELKKENLIIYNYNNDKYYLNDLLKNKKNILNKYIILLYNMIYEVKKDCNDKLNILFYNKTSSILQEEYINKAYSFINKLDDIIICFNYLLNSINE
jgi:hypothetical protein